MTTPAARRLGAVEARQMLRHPAYPIAMLYILTWDVTLLINHEGDPPANRAYMVLAFSLVHVYAPVTFVAANLVTAATYRSRVREPLDATPVDGRQRTVGAIVGLVRGPVIVDSPVRHCCWCSASSPPRTPLWPASGCTSAPLWSTYRCRRSCSARAYSASQSPAGCPGLACSR